MNTPVQPPSMMFFDEAGCYFGCQNDSLKEELRKIEGIPNATYLVADGRVFVFEKLVQLVKEQRERGSELSLSDLASALIGEATVTAKEVVETWGVVPEPYEMAENPTGGFMIRHRPFNSRLPGTFQSKGEVQNVFATLLLGGIQSGNGDFAYRGQSMTLCDPLDTALLPPRPDIQHVEEPGRSGFTALATVMYQPGFEPVSEALFVAVKELEAEWESDSIRAARYAEGHVSDIWARTATLRLETLDDPTDDVPEFGQQDFAELRTLYPELSMLSDGSLYAWFDAHQAECCYINGWTANRDDNFLFYLIGKVAGRRYEQDTATKVGQWVAHAMLRGDTLDNALALGRAAAMYDSAIYRLAGRVADAMRFVAKDRKATDQRGHSITTMMDMFRLGRKFNTTPIEVEQRLADFNGDTACRANHEVCHGTLDRT